MVFSGPPHLPPPTSDLHSGLEQAAYRNLRVAGHRGGHGVEGDGCVSFIYLKLPNQEHFLIKLQALLPLLFRDSVDQELSNDLLG